MIKTGAKYFLFFLICFAVVCVYFIGIERHTIYGEDIALYFGHFKNKTVWDALNSYAPLGKFRPLPGIINTINLLQFNKNLHTYFLFNIGIQALIVCISTLILDLVLQSFVLSAVIGFLVGLSRFAFYDITKMLTGGSSEGLSMLFFLAFLYFILKFITNKKTADASRYKYILYALLYAILAMYTQERFVILFVYILLITFLYRTAEKSDPKKQLVIGVISVISMALHYLVNTQIAGIDYLPKNLNNFSFTLGGNSLQDGLLSIIQLNSGDFHRPGVDFTSVPVIHQFMLFVIVNLVAYAVILYGLQVYRLPEDGEAEKKKKFKDALWLLLLFVLSLIPVAGMAQLDQRWLQAPFTVFILLLCMVYKNINTPPVAKYALSILFVIHFFISDYNYLLATNEYAYMDHPEEMASILRNATKSELIRSSTANLFVLENHRTDSVEKELSSALANGDIFSFYQDKSKKIHYIDDKKFSDKEQLTGLLSLNPATDQVITFDTSIHDITSQVIEERTNWIKAQNK